MEHLTDERRNRVRTAVLAGRQANATRANPVVLPTNLAGGRHYIVLSGVDGVLNPEGEYYYELTGQHPPDRRFD